MVPLFQNDLKRRLAYSTVSQISYIVLGVALFGPAGTIGGLAHLAHQGVMKVTLFFCAGNYAETLGLRKVSDLDGDGAEAANMSWVAWVLTASGFLNAAISCRSYIAPGSGSRPLFLSMNRKGGEDGLKPRGCYCCRRSLPPPRRSQQESTPTRHGARLPGPNSSRGGSI